MTYLLAITPTGFIKHKANRFAANKTRQPSQTSKPIYFNSLDEVLALTGVVATKIGPKGKRIVYTRPADHATFAKQEMALKYTKQQLVMNANAINGEKEQLQAKIDELTALRSRIGSRQNYFPANTPKQLEYQIRGKIKYSSPAIRPILNDMLSSYKREIETLERKLFILNAAIGLKPLTRIQLTQEETIGRCGKMKPIQFPSSLLD